MTRIVYVNGAYVPAEEARISVFDRGFLFADAVYEVTCVLDGKLVDFDAHMGRLKRSLAEIDMQCPLDEANLLAMHRDICTRNHLSEGLIYLQISRGVAERDFAYPDAEPSVVAFGQHKALTDNAKAQSGIKVISIEDQRWRRRDIKTVQLLYPSMGKMAAIRAGADDAWMVENGLVTEGTSNNAGIVDERGVLITRGLSRDILHGITRASVLRLAAMHDIEVEERPFTLDEARKGREAFITSASIFVLPVVAIDDHPIGDGTPGPIVDRLRRIYVEEAHRAAQ